MDDSPTVILQARPEDRAPAWWPRVDGELAWVTLDPSEPPSWSMGDDEELSFAADVLAGDDDTLLRDELMWEWMENDAVECGESCEEECEVDHPTVTEWEFQIVELVEMDAPEAA